MWDGQGIAIASIVQLKLALVTGAPEIVRVQALGQRRPFGSTATPAHGLNQSVAIQNGVNVRGGGSLDSMRQAPQETLSHLPCSPVRFLSLGASDRRFHRLG